MRIGIRTKLVILLVTVALLPLLAALFTIVIGGRVLRTEIFGQGILSVVASETRAMQTELEKDVELMRIALQEPLVLVHLSEFPNKRSDAELKRMDKEWPNLPAESRLVREILQNDTSQILRVISRENTRVARMLVTDQYGQLLAATHRTTSFYQGNEPWWRKCYNNGKGRIYIPYVTFDAITGVWAADVCIPIFDGERVVGVAKASLDLKRWLPEGVRNVAGGKAFLVIVGEDGRILHSRDILAGRTEPLKEIYPDWKRVVRVPAEGEWRQAGGVIEAYAPILLPPQIGAVDVEFSRWTLLAYMPVREARKGLAELTMILILIGLLLIGGLFLAGLLFVDRSLVVRIRHMSQSARHVSQGELQHRADTSWVGTRLLGTDELDDLARDFNNMVRKLQRSHAELTEANQLKENFIRIAGHELRTPVSYIVGMAALMKNVRDPDRLLKAIDTMGFKAGRLDEIIQAMFKLIPEQTLAEVMRYGPVNLSKLLEQVYLDLQPWIDRRKQRLVIEPGETETILRADEAKLRDVIENLAMNAIKFTPNNGVIKISVQRQLGGHVAIEVIDQGPGIPESDRAHIFEPFYSGSDVLTHSTGKSGFGKKGMGLGLAIVKHFVDLHKGTIEFTSRPSGTTFIVQLPIEPPGRGH